MASKRSLVLSIEDLLRGTKHFLFVQPGCPFLLYVSKAPYPINKILGIHAPTTLPTVVVFCHNDFQSITRTAARRYENLV